MRIGLAQLNYKIGDFKQNANKIETVIKDHAEQCDVIIFSELCLSGYYPKDLVIQPGFFEAQQAVLEKLMILTQSYSVDIVLGLITKVHHPGKPYHNSLVWISQGKIIYTYHKQLLPVYNIFNEARHFAPGKEPGIFSYRNQQLGFLICEDGWAETADYNYECDPVDVLSQHSLDLIICINGSPSNVGKQQARLTRFGQIAAQCHAPLLFVNQIGGNDDIVFDGASFILNHQGELLGHLPAFEESVGIIHHNDNTQQITLPSIFSKHIPLAPIPLFYAQIILGLKDYVKKCNFKNVVVGVSGGIDSALTVALAVQALGKENVAAIAMPSRYSSPESLEDAILLCQHLGIQLHEFSIEEEFQVALQRFTEVFKEPPSSITEQNIQARLRGRLLMEFSNQTGALVLSTGNKSELSVGYTTLYGDMTGGFNLIGDLYKTDVYPLATYFNQQHPDTPIPERVFTKAPSAELAPHQQDTDTLPDYATLDPILKLYIEGDLLSPVERQACEKAIVTCDDKLIQKIHAMVDRAEFKRRQSAPIVRVQRRAFGMGRQFPIAATYPSRV